MRPKYSRLARGLYSILLGTLLSLTLGCNSVTTPAEVDVAQRPPKSTTPKKLNVVQLEWMSLQVSDEYNRDFDNLDVPSDVMRFDGQRVRMRGYMYQGVDSVEPQSEFIFLAELPKSSLPSPHSYERQYGVQRRRRLHHHAKAIVVANKQVPVTEQPLALTGRLCVCPFVGPDGELWALYELHVEDVEVVSQRDGYYRASLLGGC